MARKPRKPVFVDAFILDGITVRIEKWHRHGTKGYSARYTANYTGDGWCYDSPTRFFSIEECREYAREIVTERNRTKQWLAERGKTNNPD